MIDPLPHNIRQDGKPNEFVGTERSTGVEWYISRIGGRYAMRRFNWERSRYVYRPTLSLVSHYLEDQ